MQPYQELKASRSLSTEMLIVRLDEQIAKIRARREQELRNDAVKKEMQRVREGQASRRVQPSVQGH